MPVSLLDDSHHARLAEYQTFHPDAVSFALLGNHIAGYLELGLRHDETTSVPAFVYNYYLLPEYRGRGLGDQLDAFAMSFWGQRGHTRVRLRTHAANTKAMAFYMRIGWSFHQPSQHGLIFLIKKVPSGT